MNEPYKTLRFAPGQIPAGLLGEHRLKADVSGILLVTEGSLVFVDQAGSKRALASGESVAIAPASPHHLEDAETAGIELRFYRAADSLTRR